MSLLRRLFGRRPRPQASLAAPPKAAVTDMTELLLLIKLPCC
jgi:hypothetical protein